MKRILCVAAVFALCLTGCGKTNPATQAVASQLEPNGLGVSANDLETKSNPRGEGTFVFVRETRFSGVKRNLVWIVVDQQAFALNGASKDITPSLPWPREADPGLWRRTGLSPYSASEAIEILFGSGE